MNKGQKRDSEWTGGRSRHLLETGRQTYPFVARLTTLPVNIFSKEGKFSRNEREFKLIERELTQTTCLADR